MSYSFTFYLYTIYYQRCVALLTGRIWSARQGTHLPHVWDVLLPLA